MSKVEITGYYLYLGTRAVGLPAPQTPQRASGSERFCKSAARSPATTAPPARKFHGSRILANLNLASLDCSSKAAQGSRCWHWKLPQCFRFTILQARASASDIASVFAFRDTHVSFGCSSSLNYDGNLNTIQYLHSAISDMESA